MLNRILGTTTQDDIVGTAGDDRISGLAGDDVLSGLSGNDTLIGGTGDDRLLGGLGEDRLFGEVGDDFLQGGDGDDWLDGGVGNDFLSGGPGSDTYHFGLGWGTSVIDNSQVGETDPEATDTIIFNSTISEGDLNFTRRLSTLTITHRDSYEKITIDNQFPWEYDPLDSSIDLIVFADGTTLDQSQIIEKTREPTAQQFYIIGTIEDDVYAGGFTADIIKANDGNDVVYGYGGYDVLRGGRGDDQLFGGDDADDLYGGEGDDILVGGKGDDWLQGSEGNDVYVYNEGDGNDYIANYHYSGDHPTAGFDELRLGEGITPQGTAVFRDFNSAVLMIDNGARVTITDHFLRPNQQIDRIVFADGTIWYPWKIEQLAQTGTDGNEQIIGNDSDDLLRGLGGNDRIQGLGGDDVLHGGSGIDVLLGAWGHDTLVGGPGDDRLLGGADGDTYVFDLGHGHDFIDNALDVNQYSSAENRVVGFDQIRFGAGISVEDILVTREDFAAHLTNRITGDSIEIYNHFVGTDTQIDRIVFDDGTIWYPWKIAVLARQGTEGDDEIHGDGESNVLRGLGGNDKIDGYGGDDWIMPGTGSDRVYGSLGQDTVSYSDASVGIIANLVDCSATNGLDKDYLNDIENVTGTSFADILTGDDNRNTLRGLYGEDSIYGGGGADRITGGGSDDYIDGGAGFDYAFYLGDRAEYIITSNGAATLVDRIAAGGEGTDTLENIEVLVFADGNVYL